MQNILKRDKSVNYKSIKYNKLKNDLEGTCRWSDSDESTVSSSEPHNRFELKNKRRQSEPLSEYISYEVKPDESLRSIALRYGCSVSAIKRINNLISDHEFYALRVIKLPIKKYGILSDVLVHQINSQSQTDETTECKIKDREEDRYGTNSRNGSNGSLTVNIGISQHLSHTDSDSAFKFLTHMDEDLKKIRQSTKTVIESSDIDILNQIQILRDCDNSNMSQSLPTQKRSAFFTCDESDYGINWFNLLILAFVLCFLVPIIYVVYISESHNNTVSNHHIH